MDLYVNQLNSLYTYEDVVDQIIFSEVLKLNHEYDMCMREHEMNLMDIEMKIIQENATEDDLYQLYLTEAEEVGKKSKNIIQRLIDTILKFFKSIKNFLFGSKDEEVPEEVVLPESPDNIEKDTNGICDSILAFLSGKKEKLTEFVSNHKAATAVAATAGAVTVTGVAAKKILPRYEKLQNKLDNVVNKVKSYFGKGEHIPTEEETILKDALNEANSCGSRINKSAKSIFKRNKKDTDSSSDSMTYISRVTSVLESYKKKINSAFRGKYGSFKGLSSSNRHYDRLEELSGMTNRSEKEEKEYKKLLNKYGSSKISRNGDDNLVRELEGKIDSLLKYNHTIQDNAVKNKLSDDGLKKAVKEIKPKFKDIQNDYNTLMERLGKKE